MSPAKIYRSFLMVALRWCHIRAFLYNSFLSRVSQDKVAIDIIPLAKSASLLTTVVEKYRIYWQSPPRTFFGFEEYSVPLRL